VNDQAERPIAVVILRDIGRRLPIPVAVTFLCRPHLDLVQPLKRLIGKPMKFGNRELPMKWVELPKTKRWVPCRMCRKKSICWTTIDPRKWLSRPRKERPQ
jgi:hypothetical protein